ncbi:hypothetical protein [Synechococcus sp. MIT S9508]|uniref:hypothetical protein n=1 Tax=Synechococcus sp. MIT S9508 TaxID=1801629 RepID=UPI00082CA4E1|nr:hypothetical protein [Synechococcus sp. MIT S9508]
MKEPSLFWPYLVAAVVGGMLLSQGWQYARQARIWSECVEKAGSLFDGDTYPDPQWVQAKAVRWCNGGGN